MSKDGSEKDSGRELEYESAMGREGGWDGLGVLGYLGMAGLLLGAWFLVVAGNLLVRGIMRPNRFVPSDEFDQGLIALGVGVVGVFVGVRWWRGRWG